MFPAASLYSSQPIPASDWIPRANAPCASSPTAGGIEYLKICVVWRTYSSALPPSRNVCGTNSYIQLCCSVAGSLEVV